MTPQPESLEKMVENMIEAVKSAAQVVPQETHWRQGFFTCSKVNPVWAQLRQALDTAPAVLAKVREMEAKIEAAYHLLNHVHREVASLEDFDAASLMSEIEQTLNGTRVFDDNKALWKENERLEALLQEMEAKQGEVAKSAEQPDDCRKTFDEWCAGWTDVYSQTLWKAWRAAWNARQPERESVDQRYAALRAKIGDEAIEKLMAGEAGVVPLHTLAGGYSWRLIELVFDDQTGEHWGWKLHKKRLDRPQPEEPKG